MKPLLQSRTLWFAVASATLSTLSSSMVNADDVPRWVVSIISALAAGTAAGCALLRVSDSRK